MVALGTKGVNVSVGGGGDGVIVTVGGMGDDVIVGAGEAVGIRLGSAAQPVKRISDRITIKRCFMVSPLWGIMTMMVMSF